MNSWAEGILFGVAAGDALGVPFEFKSREELEHQPVTEMVGYGTWNQPPGTWSDDSSLTFCLAEALTEGYDLENVARKFIQWKEEGYWSAHGKAFDIGATTHQAIRRLKNILENGHPEKLVQLKGSDDEYENGNGSLMRILPLVFAIKDRELTVQFNTVWENSALTHRHIRAAMGCMIYLKIAEFILQGQTADVAYDAAREAINQLWKEISFPVNEMKHFKHIIAGDIRKLPVAQIHSGGYVIDALEASLWCFLKTKTYKEAVLAAVNLGQDTDTTAAITGGLAGLYYGVDEIPESWINKLSRKNEIAGLGQKLKRVYL